MSLFVIIAIVIVGGILVFFVLKDNSFGEKKVSSETQEVYDAVVKN